MERFPVRMRVVKSNEGVIVGYILCYISKRLLVLHLYVVYLFSCLESSYNKKVICYLIFIMLIPCIWYHFTRIILIFSLIIIIFIIGHSFTSWRKPEDSLLWDIFFPISFWGECSLPLSTLWLKFHIYSFSKGLIYKQSCGKQKPRSFKTK